MARDQIAIGGQIFCQKVCQAFHVVTPVAVKFAGHAEPVDELNAVGRHARPRGIAHHGVKGSAGVDDDKNVETRLCGGKRDMRHANIDGDAGDDQLLASRLLNGIHKLFTIPSLDLTGAMN